MSFRGERMSEETAKTYGTETLNPVQYEIFRHRLFNILEEGRIAMRMVSGSPVVVEGGETLCSFYTSDGTPILTAAGILLHCTGARDFVIKAIEWYEQDPGIVDGDQMLFNDPYIGGQHLPDQIILKPIFYRGKRIAWTGAFMHESEIGAIEPGGMPPSATEIWHEGVAILGLKIVDAGKFRPEVFNTIVRHSRDPHTIGLDLKGRIAANNVCARRYLELVERYGLDFVEAASWRIIDDSEKMARARLRDLPDGVWRSRLYGDTNGLQESPFKVVCTMTKKGEEISFDYTGSSPQNRAALNCTLAGTWGSLFVVLASQLFWDVPWNGGMLRTVKLVAPQGTVVNCKFPAACSNGVNTVGCQVTATAHECIAKMLYAGGKLEDVNSSWRGTRGAGPYFGGVNQYGQTVAGAILEGFAAGVGAAPMRDGVDTGANMMNPQSNLIDVEMLESNLPILYLARRQATDSGGFGKFRGGMAPEMVYMIHGTDTFRVGFFGAGRRTPANWGMFGGYPTGPQEARIVRGSDAHDFFRNSRSLTTFEDLGRLKGEHLFPTASYPSIPFKDGDVFSSRQGAGGGFGDPLERDPALVARDVRRLAVSAEAAQGVFGVILDPKTGEPLLKETESLREKMRAERRGAGRRK